MIEVCWTGYDRINGRESDSHGLRVSFRCAATAGHFYQTNQNRRLVIASARPADSRYSWSCSRYIMAPLDFSGTPQKIATTGRGCLPGFARSGAKRLSSGARAASWPKRNNDPSPGSWKNLANHLRHQYLDLSSYLSRSVRFAARRTILVYLSRASFCRQQAKSCQPG